MTEMNQIPMDLEIDPVDVAIRLSSLRGAHDAIDGVLEQVGLSVSAMVTGHESELSQSSLRALESLPQAYDHLLERLDALLDAQGLLEDEDELVEPDERLLPGRLLESDRREVSNHA